MIIKHLFKVLGLGLLGISFLGFSISSGINQQFGSLKPIISEIHLEDPNNTSLESLSEVENGTLLIFDFEKNDDSKVNENVQDAAEVEYVILYKSD